MKGKVEQILREISANKNNNLTTDEEDVENKRPGPPKSENKLLRRKHVSNIEIYENRTHDNRFPSSAMDNLGQPARLF